MDGEVRLRGRQRQRLLEWHRHHPDPQVRLRAQMILLLADGHPWALIAAVLFCSSRTIASGPRRLQGSPLALTCGRARWPVRTCFMSNLTAHAVTHRTVSDTASWLRGRHVAG